MMAGPDSVKADFVHYCDRCDRPFGTQYALDMHSRDLLKHNCCGNNLPTLSRMQVRALTTNTSTT